MTDIPHVRDLEFKYAVVETVSPLVRRIVARNPGPFTAHGTGTYIVGHGRVAVIDPGPLVTEHIDALLKGLGGETIERILITHTHMDHSPAAAPVKSATGAKTYGFGPHGSGATETSEEGGDTAFTPDVITKEGDVVSGEGWTLRALYTPGHASNHLCFALDEERLLFSGDHVMGWSTTVISPPDGNMTAYMASLARLLERDDAIYLPTHGPAIKEPQRYVRALIAHRGQRRGGILQELSRGERTIPDLVAALYVGLDPRLKVAAGRSVLAHLVELKDMGRVEASGAPPLDAKYRLK
jgi:glyoxylase-like metal-dependent hydrolase (beta-lactamase superfamily II)